MTSRNWGILLVIVLIQTSVFGQHAAYDTYLYRMSTDHSYQPGAVYLMGGSGPQVVANLLANSKLETNNSWISNRELKVPFTAMLSQQAWWVYGDQGWQQSHTAITFESLTLDTRIEGEHELPSIVNRPLSGDRSQKNAEQRIVAMRRQLSQALATGRAEGRLVVVCVGVQTLTAPVVRLRGYRVADPDATSRYVAGLLQHIGLKSNASDTESKTNDFLVRFDGKVLREARFRVLHEGDPSSFADSGFFLGKEVKFTFSP